MRRREVFGLLAGAVGDQDWRAEAHCRGVDPDLFYPVESDPDANAPAKAICGPCPVREPCLDFAIANKERYGVWGGLSEKERRAVARRRRRTAGEQRRCKVCGETKGPTEFDEATRGVRYECTECRRERLRRYARERREGVA